MTDRRAMLAAVVAGAVIAVIGCGALVRLELGQLREAFETDARIIHRLLSQRAAQQDAVLAMLTMLQPMTQGPAAPGPRITSVYPQIREIRQRDGDAAWPDATLQAAERESLRSRRPVVAGADFAAGSYRLLMAATPASYAARIDLRDMIPWDEWPLPPTESPVRVALEYGGERYLVQPGRDGNGPWRFEFRKRLAADSQPFDVVATRNAGWSDLPWLKMLVLVLLTAAVLTALIALSRQRAERRRAEELLRLGRVARLNALGELAAGMAHELNQPLTAILASTQAASRLLADDPPDLATARDAMNRSVEQARRASEVTARMRHAVERPEIAGRLKSVDMQEIVRSALYLIEPECARLGVRPSVGDGTATVMADPVALEQIVHNLLSNALQALQQIPSAERRLVLKIGIADGRGVLTIQDTGRGIPDDVLPRIFEPFYTTRSGGLGLGLSLCESLAAEMGGTLTAANAAPRGALFTLTLPLAAGS